MVVKYAGTNRCNDAISLLFSDLRLKHSMIRARKDSQRIVPVATGCEGAASHASLYLSDDDVVVQFPEECEHGRLKFAQCWCRIIEVQAPNELPRG
jgi:hypothetical protein